MQQKEELKKVEKEMQEKGVEGKNKIKERFNEMAQQVTIDTSEFMNALLKKNQLRKEESKVEQQAIEEVKIDVNSGEINKATKSEEQPALDENDTLASTPTPLAMSKSEAVEHKVEDMLDQIDQINL